MPQPVLPHSDHLHTAAQTAAGAAASVPELPYPYTGPDELRAPLLRALRSVADPELSLSIVDVGLIYGLTVDEHQAHVRLTMTSAACPVADLIIDELDRALDRAVPAGLEILIELVWEPPWTPERMSERGRRASGW